MTDVQTILKAIKNNEPINQRIHCFKVKKDENLYDGSYRLWLVNGKYSTVTPEHYKMIEPYIVFHERIVKSPMEKLYETIKMALDTYQCDIAQEQQTLLITKQ